MIDFLIEIRPFLYGTFFALMAILGGFSIQRYIRIIQIRKEFRDAILAELIGQYPITTKLTEDDFLKIKNTIPTIRTLCQGYREHVNIYRRKFFDRTVKQYCEDGNQLAKFQNFESYYNSVVYQNALPMKDPQKVFKHDVKFLLSF